MTRKLFEIVVILVGCILGSLATLTVHVVPTQVSYVTNQNAHVYFSGQISELNIEGKSMLPVHEENGYFKFSPTLTLDDLTTENAEDNYILVSKDITIDDTVDNCYLQADLELTGDDEMNKCLRVLVQQGKNRYYLSQANPSVVTDIKLSKNAVGVKFCVWYELNDPNCTIDNINSAVGTDVKIKLYANVKEQ